MISSAPNVNVVVLVILVFAKPETLLARPAAGGAPNAKWSTGNGGVVSDHS